MGEKSSQQQTQKTDTDSGGSESRRVDTTTSTEEREGSGTASESGFTPAPVVSPGHGTRPTIRRARDGDGQNKPPGVGSGYVGYDTGPDPAALSDRYGMRVRQADATRLQRLEAEHGSQRVRRWADEGMTIETMGKPRDMKAFRERQDGRPEEVPTDIERRNDASVKRNVSRNRDDGPAGETGVPDVVRNVVSSPGTSMDDSVQREMESKMGGDFSDVQMHTGPKAAAAADSINARAFTVGNHVAFNSGEYQPQSDAGKKVLAHELTHVRQQTDGRISLLPKSNFERSGGDGQIGRWTPQREGVTIQPKLEVSSPDDPAEREAERVAEAVMQMDSESGNSGSSDAAAESAAGTETVNRKVGGSVSHEGGQVEGSSKHSKKFKGKNSKLKTGLTTSLNGQVKCTISERKDGKYELALQIGLSGSLKGNAKGNYKLNNDDDSLRSGSGTVKGKAKGSISGRAVYTQTRVFDKEKAAQYRSHLKAIEDTPLSSLPEAANWPEFGVISKIKALKDSSPQEIAAGMGGVMGDPEAVDVLKPGESYSLETGGGWSVSLKGDMDMKVDGLSLGVGAKVSGSSNWEKSVDVIRMESSDEEESSEESEEEGLREVVNESLFFDTGESNPTVGKCAAENEKTLNKIATKLSKLQELGSPDTVEFNIAGHASQRWKAAGDNVEKRRRKNKILGSKRAEATKKAIKELYNSQVSGGSWPDPKVRSMGSLEAQTEWFQGLDPSTNDPRKRRSDVTLRIDKPEPETEEDGSKKIKIKIGFTETSTSSSKVSLSQGMVSGGRSSSSSESHAITSVFEVSQSRSYFDDLYKKLVNVSTPKELQKIQQDDVYFYNWVKTDMASSMRKQMGPNFSIGGAKVKLRYGSLSQGSWEFTKGGIKSGSGRTAGGSYRGEVSLWGNKMFQAGTSYTADIEKVPGGFEVSLQEIRGFMTRKLSGTILSPDELSVIASRAEDAGEWSNHGKLSIRTGFLPGSGENSLKDWNELRPKVANPKMSHLSNDRIKEQWKSFRKNRDKYQKEKGINYSKIEAQFEDCARANAIADYIQKWDENGKLALESVATDWAGGGEIGMEFELPDVVNFSKDEVEELRHVRVPGFVAKAQRTAKEMEAGSSEIPDSLKDKYNDISQDLDSLHTQVTMNQHKFEESINMAEMVGEINTLQKKVTDHWMAMLQIEKWDPNSDFKDYGKEAISKAIERKRRSIKSYASHQEDKISKAEEENTFWNKSTASGTWSPLDYVPNRRFYDKWGEQLGELKSLCESHPDIDFKPGPKYYCDDSVWERYTKLLEDNEPYGGWTTEHGEAMTSQEYCNDRKERVMQWK